MSRILVVDDLETNRFLLEEALEGLADEIHTAADGTSAVDLARRLAPEVVVLDFQMPGIDGIETARRIKEEPKAPFAWVLLLSGYREANRGGFTDGLVDRFFEKPYRLDDVRNSVREGLRIAARRRGSGPDRVTDGETGRRR